MRIDADTRIWVVTDARAKSTLPDVCHETSLAGLHTRFSGGLTMAEHPTIFTDAEEAHAEASNRLLVRRAANWLRKARGFDPDDVARVTLHDEDGRVVYEEAVR